MRVDRDGRGRGRGRVLGVERRGFSKNLWASASSMAGKDKCLLAEESRCVRTRVRKNEQGQRPSSQNGRRRRKSTPANSKFRHNYKMLICFLLSSQVGGLAFNRALAPWRDSTTLLLAAKRASHHRTLTRTRARYGLFPLASIHSANTHVHKTDHNHGGQRNGRGRWIGRTHLGYQLPMLLNRVYYEIGCL